MVFGSDKYYYLTLSFNESFSEFSFNDTTTEVTKENILGMVIDNKPDFKSHLKNICKKNNQKLSALTRTWKLTALNQREKNNKFFH